ncbi:MULTISPECIES: hypothetical protein [Burkholderia cepacia complex]|uniref:hypothetical protein n=1 Tax=Burkholderia cepacia complex TaxID=87882 RepID=UPI00163A7CD6|nr:hypothetical protein [Burkholderia cenocepacia]
MAIKAGVSGLSSSAVGSGRRAVEGAAAGHYPEEWMRENRRILLGNDGDEPRCRRWFFRALPRLNRGNGVDSACYDRRGIAVVDVPPGRATGCASRGVPMNPCRARPAR